MMGKLFREQLNKTLVFSPFEIYLLVLWKFKID